MSRLPLRTWRVLLRGVVALSPKCGILLSVGVGCGNLIGVGELSSNTASSSHQGGVAASEQTSAITQIGAVRATAGSENLTGRGGSQFAHGGTTQKDDPGGQGGANDGLHSGGAQTAHGGQSASGAGGTDSQSAHGGQSASGAGGTDSQSAHEGQSASGAGGTDSQSAHGGEGVSPAVAAMMTAVVRLSTCSGTIVDREWVLSAKHCLSPWNETITSQRPTGHVSRTADLVKYQWNTNVELLHFTPPFEDVPRVPLYSGTTKSIWGRAVTCYGYGGTAELTTGTWLIESREPNVWTIIPNPLGQTFAAGVSGGPCILDDAVVGVIWGWSGVDNNLPVWGAVSDVPSSFDWIATSMTDRRMSSVYADNDRNQRNHTELFRTGTDGYLNYYFASPSWTKDADSLRTTRVMGEVSAVYSMARGHSEVFFQGEDGKLHFSFAPPNSSWNHDSQSFDVAGQLLGKVAAVYAPYDASQPYDGHSEAFVQGSDGMLYRFFVPRSGTWQYENPIGPEVPRGDLSLVYAKHRSHSEVFYVGDDGYLHYAYFEGGRWHCDRTSFMAAGPIRGRVAAVYSDAQNHSEVFARGADGYLHHFFVTGVNGNEVWAHDGSSFVGSGQVDGDIAAVYAPTTDRPHSEVFFRGADGWVHRYFVAVSGENWQHDSASFGAGGPIAGDLTAAFSIARNHTEFFYRGTDGKTHNYYMDPVTNAWIHDDASFL